MPYFKPSGGGGGSGSLSGTIGRLLRFIGSSTNAGDSAFAAEDANGINVTGGNLNATQGSLASMARGGAGHIGSICLANVSGSRAETALTQALGTGDWSAYTKVLMPSSLPTATQYVWSIYDPSSSDCVFANLESASGGVLRFQAKKTGETNLVVTINSSTLTTLLGQVVGLGVKRSGNVCTFYINGVSVGSVTGNACTVSYSTSAKSQAGNIASSVNPFLGNIYCNRIYNRALSDAEFAAIGSGGVAASDEWAIQTPIATSNFSVGADGWGTTSASQVTVTGATTDPGSVEATLKCERTAAGSGRADVYKTISGAVPGKWYRVSAYVYNENISSNNYFTFSSGGGGPVAGKSVALVPVGTGVVVSGEVFCNASDFRIGPATSADTINSASVTNGSKYYVKDITIIQIGCISAPNFAQGNGATLYDRSPNGLHSVLSGTYTHTIPVKRIVVDDLQVMNDVIGNFGANQGNLPSAVRSWSGGRGAVLFGSTSGSRAEAVLTGQALGTGDFTIIKTIRIPTANPSAQQYLFSLWEDSNNYIHVYLATSGILAVVVTKASASTFPSAFNVSAVSQYPGQAINYSISRTGTTLSVTVNGILVASTTVAGLDVSYSAAAKYVVGNVGNGVSTPYQSRIYWAPLYNRALTTAEIAEAGLYGISSADEWGNCTPIVGAGIVNGDFTAFTGPVPNLWTLSNYTGTDLGPGLRITAGAGYTDNFSTQIRPTSLGIITAGKRYRISVTARLQTGPGNLSVSLSGSGASSDTATFTLTGSLQTFVFEAVSTISSTQRPSIRISGGTASVSQMDISLVKLEQIGCIADPDLAAGQGGTLPGRSTNYLDFTLYGSWTHVIPKWSGEWWSRLPWYLFNSISAEGTNYERAFGKWATNVFQFGVEKGGSGTLRDFALMSGTVVGILIRAATNLPYANGWRTNKGTASITAGSTYTPADTINDLHVVTITGGSGTTPIALASLLSDANYGRVVRIMVKNSSGTSITVTTTGAFTNISQVVTDTSQIMITVSIFGTQCFATLAT